ncbi:ABC transporter permease [Candidatus Marimicrobium litorale]|uniref:ABC transporter permease n=1 Tax=Candidatus Marimicrobium litorale TaxID=2518991 RepID=A0ABT3T1T4_9GAMM|nr:ABC transporter permease [Candidatus Marimicrobium litorale]MCX2976208.1 ABC transporter permease [Candidatus Marimicrobium litorale]
MEHAVIQLSPVQLALAFLPVVITLAILFKWSFGVGRSLYALGRMLLQLLLIGYVLAWIFGAGDGWLVLIVLLVMLLASSWIALGTVGQHRRHLLVASLVSIAVGGGLTLALVTQAVLQLDPWFLPRYMVPLAGMVFANAMTAVSLCAERLYAEIKHGEAWDEARQAAYSAAMIPVINSLFAVGLVSLPGMMTGQILSGVSPLVAARYQIMVMCMIFASAGISTALFLAIVRRHLKAADES